MSYHQEEQYSPFWEPQIQQQPGDDAEYAYDSLDEEDYAVPAQQLDGDAYMPVTTSEFLSPPYDDEAHQFSAVTSPSRAGQGSQYYSYAESPAHFIPSHHTTGSHGYDVFERGDSTPSHPAAQYNSQSPQYLPQPSMDRRGMREHETSARSNTTAALDANANSYSTRLVPTSALPDIYRGLFKFGVFNAVQSQCFSQVMESDVNMVISAPTGSGKTVLFELAVIRLFAKLQGHASSCKCIYLAPTKALCSERYRDWSAKFEVLGITCCELTGDTVIDGRDPWGNAKNASIIISTPEKLDSLSRQWNDHVTILSQIKVFLVDEVHILNETRGSVLEVVISRMKARGSAIRFMLVSATVPNIEDIAAWIKGHSNENTVVKQFGEEYRSCKLTRFVKAYPKKNQNDFQFNRKLDFELYAAMEEHSERKPVLIFVATRKGVIGTADQLSKDFTKALEQRRNTPWQKPARIEATFQDKQLQDFATNGIGVHHAGLSMEDRRMTETLFLNRTLHVVVATSTLAMGVNLPAHTVVIKGTRIWQDTEWKEYSDLDVIQMMGRAGRPQFDKEGVVIIMCDSQSEYKYQRMKAGETVIESSLHMNLVEHLNSEIGLGTITDTASANLWLQDSFLYQRIQKNPSRYGLTGQAHDSWRQRLEALVTNSINKLRETELVQDLDGKDRFCLTEFGEIMSKYYLRHTTMTSILDLNPCASVRDILELLCGAEEFNTIRLRAGEKTVYNLIKDDDAIRFKIKKVEKPADKTFILIQAILGGVSLSNPIYKSPDSQPHLDAMTVFRHASRIVRVVGDVAIAKQNGAQLKHSMDLLRSLNAKAWEDRPIVLRQLDKLGEKSIKVLASHGITSIPILRAQNAVRLGNLLNRKRQFGEELLASANELPQYTVSVSEVSVATFGGTQPIAATLEVICGLEKQLVEPTKSKKNKRSLGMTTVLTLTSDYKWIDYRRIPTKYLRDTKSFSVVASLDKPSQSVVVHISPDDFGGLAVVHEYKPSVPPSEFPTLETRPLTALDWEMKELHQDPSMCAALFEPDEEVSRNTGPSANNLQTTVEVPSAASAQPPSRLPNGNVPCKHTCKDKGKCRHLCCRDGIPTASSAWSKNIPERSTVKPTLSEEEPKQPRKTSGTICPTPRTLLGGEPKEPRKPTIRPTPRTTVGRGPALMRSPTSKMTRPRKANLASHSKDDVECSSSSEDIPSLGEVFDQASRNVSPSVLEKKVIPRKRRQGLQPSPVPSAKRQRGPDEAIDLSNRSSPVASTVPLFLSSPSPPLEDLELNHSKTIDAVLADPEIISGAHPHVSAPEDRSDTLLEDTPKAAACLDDNMGDLEDWLRSGAVEIVTEMD